MTEKIVYTFTLEEQEKARKQLLEQLDIVHDVIIKTKDKIYCNGNKDSAKLSWSRVLASLLTASSHHYEIVLGHKRIIDQTITRSELK